VKCALADLKKYTPIRAIKAKLLNIICANMQHMLQKRNDFEIIENLLSGAKHIRQISQKTQLSPSTVMRILRSLENEGIVDFRVEGKNKTYYLKDTPEAETYKNIAESYRLLKTLQNPKLRRIIKTLTNMTHGELIVLFGSYANNTAREDSDIDVYVETRSKELQKNLKGLSEKLSIKIGKIDKDTYLANEIIKNHVIIQNTQRFYQIIK
jgi:predicted nucleotidyltransferase/DNA-binding HxlR family transcriptional regulator